MSESRGNRRKDDSGKGKAAYIILIIILIGIIVFCLYQIIPYFLNLAVNVKIDEQVSEDAVDDEEDWRDVVIDFDYLKGINEDIVAWIRFDNTDVIAIDYPILQDEDSTLTYLHKNIYGEYSYAGCIFMDATNSSDFTDPQTIVYGHNMRNGSMFGTLKKYRRDNSVYEDNQYFTIYTPDASYRYHIFTYFITSGSSYVYRTGFSLGSEVYAEHVAKLNAAKMLETDDEADEYDNIVVLSTCTSRTDSERFVVIGKVVDMVSYDGLDDK